MDLAKRQVELEIEMKNQGARRFDRRNEDHIRKHSAGDTAWNSYILSQVIDTMSEGIKSYLEYYNGRRGKPSRSLKFLRLIDPNEAAYITIKYIFNGSADGCLLRVILKNIGARVEDQIRFANLEKNATNYVRQVKKRIARRATQNYKHKRGAMRAAEKRIVKGNKDLDIDPKPEIKWTAWNEKEQTHVGAKLVDIFFNCVTFNGKSLIYKEVLTDEKKNKMKVYLRPTDAYLEWVEEYKEVVRELKPMYTPCVVEPVEWTSVNSGGYHIPEIAETFKLVKCRASQAKKITKERCPVFFDAVNTLQKVPWKISKRVLNTANMCMEYNLQTGMPSTEPLEKIPSPISSLYDGLYGSALKDVLTESEWEDFIGWKADTSIIHDLENVRKADIMKIHRTLSVANEYKQYDRFFYIWTGDFRSRLYCKSDTISPQGDDIQKGLIKFAEGKPLGDEGYFWLAVHGANVYGNDKILFEERVAFIESITEEIRDIVSDPFLFKTWAGVDKPWQFLNWCYEWADLQDWMDEGKDPADFISYLPIAMDASCSGLQHYSAILRDERGGAAVNLVPDSVIHDIYGDVAEVTKDKLSEISEDLSNEYKAKLAYVLLNMHKGIPRDLTKKPTMTLCYGSTRIRCLKTTSQYITELQVKENKLALAEGRQPISVHGFKNKMNPDSICKKRDGEKLLAGVIWDSLGEVVVKAKEAMGFIQKLSRIMAKNGASFEFNTPINFPMDVTVMLNEFYIVKTQLFGETKIKFTRPTKEFNSNKMGTASAPNFIHSLDASHLMLSVVKLVSLGVKDISVIHDSFGTHACNTSVLRDVVRNTFVDMYQKHDVLEELLTSCEEKLMKEIDLTVPSKGNLDLEVVRESEYMIG